MKTLLAAFLAVMVTSSLFGQQPTPTPTPAPETPPECITFDYDQETGTLDAEICTIPGPFPWINWPTFR